MTKGRNQQSSSSTDRIRERDSHGHDPNPPKG
jgi:hypothetical protein